MNVTFYRSDKPREVDLAAAFKTGIELHGDRCNVISSSQYIRPLDETDIAVIIGVKGISRRCIDEHQALGKKILYLDKGFVRLRGRSGGTLHVKISYNNFQPLAYFMKKSMPADRWELLKKEALIQGYDIAPQRRRPGIEIMLSGPSEKYSAFHNLFGGSTEYCKSVVQDIRLKTDRPIVYWPKQSWKDAVPIDKTIFGRPPLKIEYYLKSAHVFITHGSNSSVKALLEGVPVLTLGPAITAPVAGHVISVSAFEEPFYPDDDLLNEWLHAMSYCQWTAEEIQLGLAWKHLREQVIQ